MAERRARLRVGRAADRSRSRRAPGRPLAAARARGRRPRGAEGAGGRCRGARRGCRDAPRREAALGRLPDPRFPRDLARPNMRRCCERIFGFLHEWGGVPDRLARRGRSARIDRTDGDIDTLSKRLAYIRTWTYVAQRTRLGRRRRPLAGRDPRGRRPAVGCAARRADAAICRPADERAASPAEAEGEPCGRGERQGRSHGRGRSSSAGWKASASGWTRPPTPEEAQHAARGRGSRRWRPQLHLRADRFYNAPDTEIDFTEQGGLMWGENAVGKLVAGPEPLKPQVVALRRRGSRAGGRARRCSAGCSTSSTARSRRCSSRCSRCAATRR